jgi:PAS domain S-box-containing protein
MTDTGERLEAVLESITDGFVTLDADWRFTYANRRAEQMLGRSRQELLGRNGLEVFPEGIGSRIHQELDRARQEHSVIEFESLTRPGNRWFEVRAYPAEENGLTVYFRDITRKKRAQESIALQARMLDAVGQAVIAVANDGTVFYWNKAAEKLLGWTAEQVIGRAAIAVMHPEHEKGGVAEALKRLEHAETWAGEVTLRRRDGTRFPAHISDSPIQDEQGQVVGMVRVATDASARHADEQAQRLLAKAGSALAATLDYEHTLAALVQFAVPELADCCIVDVVERDGSGRRVEVAWSSAGQGAPRFSAQTLNEKPTAT